MKVIIKKVILFLMCGALLIQTGCWDQNPYEKIGFILQLGLEISKDDELLVSMTSPVVAPEVKEKVEFLHTSTQTLIRASTEDLSNVSGKRLKGGKIQQIYFSEELAQKGINDFFGNFIRDPEKPLLANVVIVEGSPREMLELSKEFEDKPRPAFYINDLLMDAYRRSKAPEARIYHFSIDYYSKTIDPVVPIISYDKDNVKIAGSALFNGDKMVGKIDTDHTLLLIGLMGKKILGEYIYKGHIEGKNGNKIKKGEALFIKISKGKIKIDTSGKMPVININLNFKGILDEYDGAHNLDNNEKKKELEEFFVNSVREEYLKILHQLQKLGADPVGFGEIVRSKHNSYWKSVEWKEVYKKAIFNLDIKMNIESYGTIK